MFHLKILTTTAAVVLTVGCASAPPDKHYDSPQGTWRTKIQTESGAWLTHGVMTFSEDKSATYTFHNGRVQFNNINESGKWKGYWVEDTWGTINCAKERDGSRTWGEAIFQFDPTYNTYRGTWDKCGDGKRNAWVGNRT